MKREKIIKEFNLKPFGQKGWLKSDDVNCPQCSRSDKFGIKFTKRGGVTHCFYCHQGFSLYRILKEKGRTDLLSKDEIEVEEFNLLKDLEVKIANKTDFTPPKTVKKPIGYKPLKEKNNYLDSRNFSKKHYELFKPGTAWLHPQLDKDYLVFLIYQHNELKGWLARSLKSKEWHKDNLKRFKKGKDKLMLRYINDTNAEFSKLLGGFDEVTEATKDLIIVEGLFDKVNVDTELFLLEQDEIKCLCTWGDGITEHQARLIGQLKVENVYIMYDYGTQEESKQAASELQRFTENVYICEIKQKGADPGTLKAEEVINALYDSRNFLYFYASKMNLKLK